MPTGYGADHVDTVVGGGAFALRLNANPYGVVTDAWLFALDDIPSSEGTPCGTWGIGGGHGIGGSGPNGGCGGRLMASSSATCSSAYDTVTYENSYGLQSDSNDKTGTGCVQYWYHCNHDCATYPIDRG